MIIKRIYFIKFALITIVFTGFLHPAFSQEILNTTFDDSLQYSLNDIVITASRSQRSIFLTPHSINKTILPMENIHHTRNMPEALSHTPGVFVQKTNHGGGSPFLRGLTGNQTLLLWDGIRVNNATFRYGPNQYTNLIDAFTIQNIEILKGGGSTQYGSDAIGGVIQAFTPNSAFRKKAGWNLKAGTRFTTRNMEYSGRMSLRYNSEYFGIEGGFTARKFGDLYGGKNTGKQSPSGYSETDWNVKAKWKLNNQISFTTAAQQVNQKDVPLYHRVALENFEYYIFQPQKLLLSYARLEASYTKGLLRGWSITPLYKKSIEGRSYHKSGNNNYFDEKDEVGSAGLVAKADLFIAKNWSSTTGAEWYKDKVSSSRIISFGGTRLPQRGLYPDDSKQQNAALYSLHTLDFGKIKLEAGLRYNVVKNIIPGRFITLPGINSADVRLKSSALVGNAGLTYLLGKSQMIYTSFNNGFRAPGIDDLGTLGLVDFRYEIPAFDLRPEKSQHTEIGYRFKNKTIDLHAAAFYLQLNNLISRVRSGSDSIQGYPVYYKTNDQTSFIRGFEFSMTFPLLPDLNLKTMASGQFGQNLTRNEPMRRIPPIFGLQQITYKKGKWEVAIEHQWAAKQSRLAQGDKEDNRIPAGGTPGWQILNFYTAFHVPEVDFWASINNIFDLDYRFHGSGINGMGRALTLSAMICLDWRSN